MAAPFCVVLCPGAALESGPQRSAPARGRAGAAMGEKVAGTAATVG